MALLEIPIDEQELNDAQEAARHIADFLADEVEAGDTALADWRDKARDVADYLEGLTEEDE